VSDDVTSKPSAGRRWIKRIGLVLIALIVLLIVTGSIYEFLGRRRAAHEFPPPGRLVDIGGRRIQLDCRGAGKPTVVLEAGLDINGSLAWALVHDSIAATTRTCAYSRAGIMWSDPRPGPVDGTTVAEDLHAALEKANEPGPYVMVGHSLGGPYIMTFTKHYGADVAGLVFVDASHPDQVARFKQVVDMPEPSSTPMKVVAALAWTGLVRAMLPADMMSPKQPKEAVAAMSAYAPTSLGNELKEAAALDRTFAEAGTFRTLGDRPIVVLTANAPMAESVRKSLKISQEKSEEFQAVWRKLHDEEASWSSRSRHQLVADATHYIQIDRPDVVIEAVRSVVEQVRGGGS
jgi:pimeloyl-ACP methyl ester carboxylesterase